MQHRQHSGVNHKHTGGRHVCAARDSSGNLLTTTDPLQHTTTNTYTNRGQVASSEDALHNFTYFGYDTSGNLGQQIDALGTLTTYSYDAFGNRLRLTGTTPNIYRFGGEQWDPDLNLYYNRARYLNTSTGRFLTVDSNQGDDEDPLSLHKYLYASADPENVVDPTGNQGLAEFADIGSMISTLANLSVPLFAVQGGVPGVELKTDRPKESSLVFPTPYGFQDLRLHDTSFG